MELILRLSQTTLLEKFMSSLLWQVGPIANVKLHFLIFLLRQVKLCENIFGNNICNFPSTKNFPIDTYYNKLINWHFNTTGGALLDINRLDINRFQGIHSFILGYRTATQHCVCVGLLRHPCAPLQWYTGALCTIGLRYQWLSLVHYGVQGTKLCNFPDPKIIVTVWPVQILVSIWPTRTLSRRTHFVCVFSEPPKQKIIRVPWIFLKT